MLRGSYKTRRDGGIEYTYEASCGMQGEDWHWRATIWREGRPCAQIDGVMLAAPSFVEDPVLKQLVEDSIEQQKGVA